MASVGGFHRAVVFPKRLNVLDSRTKAIALLQIEHKPTGSGLVSRRLGKDGDCLRLAIRGHGSEFKSQTPTDEGKTRTPNLIFADGRGEECALFEGIDARSDGGPVTIRPPGPSG